MKSSKEAMEISNMHSNSFTVEVLVNGRPLKEFTNKGLKYIEARVDTQYSLRVRNHSWQRAEIVASIDGLDVITGESATATNRGYLIEPNSTIEIKGFRESNTSVGTFLFTSKAGSYAQSKNNQAAQNVGVIGVRIFNEKRVPIVYHQPFYYDYVGDTSVRDQIFKIDHSIHLNDAGGTYCGSLDHTGSLIDRPQASAGTQMRCFMNHVEEQPKGFDRGTSWGERKQDVVVHRDFERGYQTASFDLYYASRESLLEMGVPFKEETAVALPQSFPGYAKPPKNWHG